ncbi:hypothetical protein YSA_10847 [Pseudomonas putida ND6]|uniref:Uncharacterized protein n=1 Tax=Pseudomonas putida ND6 TaxID=231023 RepID=I3V4I3_PSEPU|nr:hypothetical protein YSA_10847 [Pseudomonas putida ND6]
MVFIARQCNRLALSQVLWVVGLRAHADIGQLRGKLKRSGSLELGFEDTEWLACTRAPGKLNGCTD